MKPDEIKGMAREILSDGKRKPGVEDEKKSFDDMGAPSHTSIDWGEGGGGMVSTRFAAQQPYKEGNVGSLESAEHKQAFESHEDVAEHVRKIGRRHGGRK